MTGSGRMTECTGKEYLYLGIEIGMKDISHMDWRMDKGRWTITVVICMKGNGKTIKFGVMENSLSKMEMFMPGMWQVRVFYKTDEVGIFDVNLTQ